MTRMIILGPPGAGKGTQAARIAERLQIPAISTGAIFRANKEQGTELGKLAASYMDKGEYVPDSVVDSMVEDRLKEDDAAGGFLLDGYPRTPAQVTALDAMLERAGTPLDVVLLISVPQDNLVQRLLTRAQIEGRADDTEEVIRRRMEVYEAQTSPLVETYGGRGLLVEINGEGDIDEVTERIQQALGR